MRPGRRARIALLVTLASVATACNGVTIGGETEGQFRDRMVIAFTDEAGLDRDRAECVVDGFLDSFEEERLEELSDDPDDLSAAETEVFLGLLEQCGAEGTLDPFDAVSDTLAMRYRLEGDAAACFIERGTEELGWARLTAIAQIRPPTASEAAAIDRLLQECAA